MVPKDRFAPSLITLIVFLALLIGSVYLAAQTQQDFGNVEVSNVCYPNFNGIPIRAKLLRPRVASKDNPLPGAIYIHGYQNNRETGDAYCLELARRGFVVLNIDAIGRGNSGMPNDPSESDFDPTFGGKSSLDYIKSLPFVRPDAVGMMGHSMGAEMAYKTALEDNSVAALVITGFGYTTDATPQVPRNMLMIIGKWDEYRPRMTGVRDIEKQWMKSEQTKAVFPVPEPELSHTYGDFENGTARRVVVPHAIHIQVSHSKQAIAETVDWMRQALNPPEDLWIDPNDQIWPIKEWATLAALVFGLAVALPLGLLLLNLDMFYPIRTPIPETYSASPRFYFKGATINGLLMWLYLPLIFCLFGLHIYVVRIDKAFPMMLLNGIVWWFVLINIFGFLIFRRWFKRQARMNNLDLADMGVSFTRNRFSLGGAAFGKTIILAVILFAVVYALEHVLESIFIVDWRFIFPFASDLTWNRFILFLIYLPFFILGFLQTNVFLHGQIRLKQAGGRIKTFVWWSFTNIMAMIVPLILFMCIQYVPLLTTGAIPLVGPGGMLTNFTMTLFHIIGVLILITPISTWFFQLTGRIYLGVFLNSMIVAWMLVSSQVVAPIPV
jgi:dienelactone hydrolase